MEARKRNRVCCHAMFFWLYALVWLVAGATVGARYLMMREVTCVQYVKCPEFGRKYGEGQCILFADPSGTTTIGQKEWSSPSIKFNQACWTDGFYLTGLNPRIVRNVTIGILSGLPVVYLIALFCLKRRLSEEKIEKLTHAGPPNQTVEKDWDNAFGSMCCFYALIFVIYAGAMIYFGVFDLNHRKVRCLSYDEKYYGGVKWVDNVGTTAVYPVADTSYQPSVLPADCWINNETVSFYDPNTYYVAGAIIFGSVMGVAIFVHCLLVYYANGFAEPDVKGEPLIAPVV
ncbi:MAG: hypothetical protein Hyperionvirus26_5 [Hyperionvirus sp.]|uniref:Uncharacterized protein n=1 Tax=Hyperionvirus sp. TaxID=2487770 RepID=A0A3G5AB57_9VIRU|nr:MAG: hypothetical protein Hyperionvirus26_5 [Hyperionvirus sp.]